MLIFITTLMLSMLQVSQGGTSAHDYESVRDTTRPEISFMQSAPDTLGFTFYWGEEEDEQQRDSLKDVSFQRMWNSASGMGDTGKKIRRNLIPDSLVVDSAKNLLRKFEFDSALFLKEQFTLRSMLLYVYPDIFITTNADTLVNMELDSAKVKILKYVNDLMLKNDHPDSQLSYLIYRQLLRFYPCSEIEPRIRESIIDARNYADRFLPDPVYVDGIELPPPSSTFYGQKVRMQAWIPKLAELYRSADCE